MLTLEPLRDPAGAQEYTALTEAVLTHDHEHLASDPAADLAPLLAGDPVAGRLTLLWLVQDDGRTVGTLLITMPLLDNLTVATVELRVHPTERRRGIARWAWAHVLEQVAEHSRTRLFLEVPSPVETPDSPGAAFAASVGARPVLHEVRRVLDLAATPSIETPCPPGYRLEPWVDHAPEALVEDLAALAGRMTVDVPRGDMDYDPEAWDVERYRAKEQADRDRGRQHLGTAALHEASGRVAGYSDLGVALTRPEVGFQWDTIVDPAHRGHGLGLALKVANHRLLTERSPQTRWLNTWNADSNSYMVAVNDQLGYVPADRWTEWQLDLAAGVRAR